MLLISSFGIAALVVAALWIVCFLGSLLMDILWDYDLDWLVPFFAVVLVMTAIVYGARYEETKKAPVEAVR